ncbi:MAG: YgcG family protein, partial [Gammaproteobacteria bacterium]|nr:YgcG family protein [Gammaproteobacteria bacterium]
MHPGLLHWLTALIWLLGFVAGGHASADVPIPPLATRVTDLTDTLAPAQRRALEERLAAFERSKGSQIAVLIVPTTRPESIEQYGIRVADAWQLGRGSVDDGVIVLMAKSDRTLRLEVGRGLEGVIPDAVANRIVEDIMVPYFRHGDFYGGLSAGIDSVTGLIQGEPLPKPTWHAPKSQEVDLGAVFFS